AFAAWKWWDKQANPDWLVEPPAATDVPEAATLTSVDGSGATLDPEDQAKEAEEQAAKRDEQSRRATASQRGGPGDPRDLPAHRAVSRETEGPSAICCPQTGGALVVEPRGVEPLTSAMQRQRSTN